MRTWAESRAREEWELLAQISSACRCFSPCAPPRGPTMLWEQSRRQPSPHTQRCMMMWCGKLWPPSLASWRRKKKRRRDLWLGCRQRSEASACALPGGLRRRRTGQHGRFSASACVDLLASGGGCAPCLQSAAEARALLQAEGWQAIGHMVGSHTQRELETFRERVFLPTLLPSACALVRSQAGSHAGAWLTAVGAHHNAGTTCQIALRRRLRLPLPISSDSCAPAPGCGGPVDVFDARACPRTGLLARQANVLEWAWPTPPRPKSIRLTGAG